MKIIRRLKTWRLDAVFSFLVWYFGNLNWNKQRFGDVVSQQGHLQAQGKLPLCQIVQLKNQPHFNCCQIRVCLRG